jgi:dihydroceramidase
MKLFILICSILILSEVKSMLISHQNLFSVKHFESKVDGRIGYWSPSTSSIDWCERNYVVTSYIAEFWNSISSLIMCLLATILFVQGLYYQIEKRFLIVCLSFGLVGLGSAYFHGTLTHLGQMADELPMVYTMIIWLFILFRMKKFEEKIYSIDILIVCGIFYALIWSYIHSLESFVLIFQIHFTLMVLGGIIKLIYLYRESKHKTKNIKYYMLDH